MISPARWLPAAPILQVSRIAVQPAIVHDLRNTAMQSFYLKPTSPLFIYYYSMCSVSLWSDYMPFFHCHCAKTMHSDPSSVDICFANAAQVFIMFWHDFR